MLPKLWINNLVGRGIFIYLINVYHAGFVPRAFDSAETAMGTKTVQSLPSCGLPPNGEGKKKTNIRAR